MACYHSHAHLIVFTHACGYYSRVATYQDTVSIQINAVDTLKIAGACLVVNRDSTSAHPGATILPLVSLLWVKVLLVHVVVKFNNIIHCRNTVV